jgi:hypothetical protein
LNARIALVAGALAPAIDTSELDRHPRRNDPLLVRFVQEPLDRQPATFTVIQCELIDVHANKAIGFGAIETTAVLHRVRERFAPMIEPVRDAVVEQARKTRDVVGSKIATNDVAAQGEWKTFCAPGPPFTKVDHFPETIILVSQLAFVYEQSGIRSPFTNGILDLIERHHLIVDRRSVQPQRQKGGRQKTRHRNANALERRRYF